MRDGTAPGRRAERHRAAALIAAIGAAVLAALAIGLATATAAPFPWKHDLAQDVLSLQTNTAPAPYVVDWNEDGRDDVVAGTRSTSLSGGVAVYLRKADGSLDTSPTSAFASGNGSSVIGFALYFRPVVADWDGDGKKDLLFGQLYGSKGVVLCSNAGADAAPVFNGGDCTQMRTSGGALVGQTTGSTTAYVSPEAVDWDEDGDLDLLVGTGAVANEKGVRLYRNTGTATAPVLADPTVVVSKTGTSGLAFETYYEPDVVDIDDDGDKDLMIGGSQRGGEREFVVRQCLNSGTDAAPSFSSCSFFFLSGLVNNVIDFHDWDGDGFLDMLRGFHSGFITNTVTYFHGMGPDGDGDGLSDSVDNCPAESNSARLKLDRQNPVQIDTDGDGAGDVCDADDDGDGADDAVDNCHWTRNGDQADVDADGRGDACDPKDDRPGYPGKGSYEWEQANKMEWGRKPVILLRADALSLGFRRDIAVAVTDEALNRGMAFSLGVIPWDADRFSGTPSADYLRANAANPNLEITQHGTYHTCVLEGGSGEEFDCGMNAEESFNLMRVGHRSLTESVDFSAASQPLIGFLPPADAYDEATGEAAAALGHRYIASAYYREFPNFTFVDDIGLVHVPWGQTACGNGFAPWINCQTTDVTAHAGVDCADESICKPTKDGRSYEPWADYAGNTLKDRCRYDMNERYDGVCSIIFELAVFDKGDGSGTLDPVSLEGYKRTLSDLQELAEEEGAIFMTLGQFAAAKLIDDTEKPVIDIRAPEAKAYGHNEKATIDFDVTDDLSGVYSVEAKLDGSPVEDGDEIDLLDLPLGEHTLTVRAEDTAGNVSEAAVTFEVVATFASLQATIERLRAEGGIDSDGIARSLLRKVEAAEAAAERGQARTARNILEGFIAEVEDQRGEHITSEAADLLIGDARAVADGL